MSKSQLSWLAVALVLGGVTVITGHPAWGLMTGVALALLGGAIAVGAARISERHGEPRGQRVSNDLVALSATAIIAVYAAGFQRTKSAADEFEAQAARRRTHLLVASAAAPPATVTLLSQPPSQITSIVATVAPSSTSAAATGSTSVPALGKDRASSSPHVQSSGPAPDDTQRTEPATAINEPVSAPPAEIATNVAVAPPAAAIPSPATPSTDATAPNVVTPKLHYKDGAYLGWGRCAHGSIQASVVIKNGRIESTSITQCETAYPCERIAELLDRVLTMQDSNVDVVSGASDSSYAFQDAVAAAMFKGQRGE